LGTKKEIWRSQEIYLYCKRCCPDLSSWNFSRWRLRASTIGNSDWSPTSCWRLPKGLLWTSVYILIISWSKKQEGREWEWWKIINKDHTSVDCSV
jgi:hypothetical protein